MALRLKKQKAIELRKHGKSYTEIKKILGVSKSTLSIWLKNYPLPLVRLRALRDWNEHRIEKFRETFRQKRLQILSQIYKEEKHKILNFLRRDIFMAGIFLYWGEGEKALRSGLSLSNTNPVLIRFFIHWLTHVLHIPRSKIRIQLHLYHDMKTKKEIQFWAHEISIPSAQFHRPYIKSSKQMSLTYRVGYGHGTCNVRVYNATLAKQMLIWLQIINKRFTTQSKGA